jgi:hypothetical protein
MIYVDIRKLMEVRSTERDTTIGKDERVGILLGLYQ